MASNAFQYGQCAAPQPPAAAQSASIAPAQIDNCCFAGWQCLSDQDWIGGYHAYRDGRCPAPAQSRQQATSAQSASVAPAQIDNCCFAGWQCNNDQDWIRGYHAYQNNLCSATPTPPGSVDSCCSLGWNCTFEFDFIMARWWYEGNNGTCNQPIQEIVDGVILEGSAAFIAQHKAAMQLLKTRAPEWHAYTTNIIRKIRESQEKPGYGALAESFNVRVWHSIGYAAAIIVHETCHVHRHYSRFYGTARPEIEHIAEEPICRSSDNRSAAAVQPRHRLSPLSNQLVF